MSSNSSSEKSSTKKLSTGSAPEYIKGVQRLIDSDEEQKNTKKLSQLKSQFGVLRKIHPYMTNSQKLSIFMRDNQFRHRVQQKMNDKGFIFSSVPLLKVYISTTRYRGKVKQQFDENDLVSVFTKFGQINFLVINGQTAYVSFQQFISAYITIKTLNQFEVDDFLRLTLKWCTQQENNQAQSIFLNKKNQSLGYQDAGVNICSNSILSSNEKYVAKYQINACNLPEFNFGPRIIGPKGSYMKKIIQKIVNSQIHPYKYTLQNIQKILKMRLRGKGSGYIESRLGKQSDQKMNLCISSKQKQFYDCACKEVDILFMKIFQDYKVSYQKTYKKHAQGLAFRVLESQANYFTQIREVQMKDIDTLDILAFSKDYKLSQKQIEEKISQRDKVRKMGLYKQADEIRNWLKCRGVILIDQKGAKGKGKLTKWNYI